MLVSLYKGIHFFFIQSLLGPLLLPLYLTGCLLSIANFSPLQISRSLRSILTIKYSIGHRFCLRRHIGHFPSSFYIFISCTMYWNTLQLLISNLIFLVYNTVYSNKPSHKTVQYKSECTESGSNGNNLLNTILVK